MIINIHIGPPHGGPAEIWRRYDTLTAPNGSIATLLNIEESLGRTDITAIDESFPGEQLAREHIRKLIENDIVERRHTILLFTVLLYNAERTVKFIRELKQEYGSRITTVVGGQLIPLAASAYANNPDVDVVCVGDAEAILPQMLRSIDTGAGSRPSFKPRYDGWVKDIRHAKFAGVSYEHFWLIEERLAAQRRLSAKFGERNSRDELGFSQLIVQGPGGPGCSWAAGNKDGACSFCALQNITQMSNTTLRDTIENEVQLVQRFGVDRIFDVANQFLPSLKRKETKRWLSEHAAIRSELGLSAAKYVYLTINSIDDEIAGMLRDIGVNETYLGLDHFHPDALKEQNKPYRTTIQHGPSPEDQLVRALDALKRNGIAFRASVVMGAARENDETLDAVRNGIRELLKRYDNARSIRALPVRILPGSRIFDEMDASGLCRSIFEDFRTTGFLTSTQQSELNRTFVEQASGVPYEMVADIERNTLDLCREFGKSDYAISDADLTMYEQAAGA